MGYSVLKVMFGAPVVSSVVCSIVKKPQQRLFFLRQLRKFNLPQELLIQFYSAIIESVLCTSITVWFGSATKSDIRRLQRTVRTAERIIGAPLPTLQDLYSSRVRKRADDNLVMEGDSVTLDSDTEMKDGVRILWLFGPETTLITGINKRPKGITVYDDVLDGRFRDRLKLDDQTGSLTITNTTTEHTGDYKLQINSVIKRFSLTVFTRLPVPIISNTSHCSSSSCSLVCSSVVNVSHVTLSWYAGMSVLSSISASDLSISLSLPLEVEYQDKNPYSCVLTNPISNQTTHLDINTLCHTCADSVHCCGPTEAVIRLVLSALVGVATVIILVYDIRSRRAERDQAHIHTSGSIEI
ncbi:uncharacterized protein LOC130073741 [Rhinichthys klamathensis goyatoka]|uniref:uncharacterized protein LOC130073741 n=1 Tax=Rhinichthys klamathensis goyatoka TaxID=3034132 RepID=UPI0024B518DD|nr:uncharacterized protein LOC130073741 [Rhinichthys klamathensis goyatoka]